ncbi:MAG TPA: carbon storage regulator [Patescibacteria group bacterium]|nr:carbon storage regulator [Gammaproteobacteria bacterium]HWA51440.1 carbon storage regulator [Patescibacteria group bacterium]
MIIITKKVNEVISVADDIEVKVLEVAENYVKMGINAPRDISVYRKKIYKPAELLKLKKSK